MAGPGKVPQRHGAVRQHGIVPRHRAAASYYREPPTAPPRQAHRLLQQHDSGRDFRHGRRAVHLVCIADTPCWNPYLHPSPSYGPPRRQCGATLLAPCRCTTSPPQFKDLYVHPQRAHPPDAMAATGNQGQDMFVDPAQTWVWRKGKAQPIRYWGNNSESSILEQRSRLWGNHSESSSLEPFRGQDFRPVSEFGVSVSTRSAYSLAISCRI